MERPVRITPQPPEEWHDDARAALAQVVPTGSPRPVRLPAVIARHPTLLPPYLEWAKAVALRGVLAPRDAALVVLRTGHRWSSAFEWAVHADTVTVRGLLDADELAAVRVGAADDTWSAHERALLRAVDELVDHGTVLDATWATLASELDEAGLVELVLTVGHYSMLSMLANAVGLPAPT